MASTDLVPFPPAMEQLPAPADFAKLLRSRLEQEIGRVREERGGVTAPEDTFGLIRPLQQYREIVADYVSALQSSDQLAKQELEAELIDAVGEQDGVPNESLSVPDLDGTTIKIAKKSSNVHTIEKDPVLAAVAAETLAHGDVITGAQNFAVMAALASPEDKASTVAELENFLANTLIWAMERLIQTGSYAPQVSKVKQFKKELAGQGHDGVAASVTVHTKSVFAGLSITREQPK